MPFPNVRIALSGLGQPVQLKRVVKEVVDFEVQESAPPLGQKTFAAVLQPIPERALMVKPEGQREWKWWRMWVTADPGIALDDVVVDKAGKLYRVMRTPDWSQGGFLEYQLTETPSGMVTGV